MYCHALRAAAATAAAMLAVASAAADTVEVAALADNTMYEGSDDNSNGAGVYLFAGRTNAALRRRALISFDVGAAVPAGATITSVQLQLYMNRTQVGARPVSLHRATASWGEAGSIAEGQEGAGGAAEPGDATWRYRFWNVTEWSALGGDFVPEASATISVSGNGFYTWGSTGSMVADVQGWLDAPPSNFGWVLVGDETQQSAKRFSSRTNGTVSRRPKLTITFEAGGACCFNDESCAVIGASACASQGGAYQGAGSSCTPNPCSPPTGACCLAGGDCAVLTSTGCASQSGVYQGDETGCAPNPCQQPTGACCFASGACAALTGAECLSQGGTPQGDGVVCAPMLCPVVLEPFVDPLPLPAAAASDPMDPSHYDIAMTRFTQMLHAEMTPITVYGAGGTYPGPTIEATSGEPITVTWRNDLRDDGGALLAAHDLPIDMCMHGAEDQSPRTIMHLHGGHVPMASDGHPDSAFPPGMSLTVSYPNAQPAATLWYHDHALGITRLNVMMGLAGFFIVRDDVEAGLGLPAGEHEIPLVIQDRTFTYDGERHRIAYPEAWQDHFYGDTVLVNGKVWPYLDVERGAYRLRILNGSNSRMYALALDSGQTFTQIGTDGGFLPAPIELAELMLAPGERADVVVDFSALAPGAEVLLTNAAEHTGAPAIPHVMKFRVQSETGPAAAVPGALAEVPALPESQARQVRDFLLTKEAEPCAGSMWMINGLGFEDVTEFPRLGTIEVWRFINRSGVMHPMHMHLVFFQVLDRQPFTIVGGEIVPSGPPVPPPPEEAGWKDTVKSMPFEITRVIAKFTDYEGNYPYHCHILEHEDHEMMRQFQTLPECPGDVDGDDEVGFQDLLAILSEWGPCSECAEDLTGDGAVGFTDLLIVLSDWGPCPV